MTKLHNNTKKHVYPKHNTLRVCRRSLMVFNGSDIAARTTGVRRSSDIADIKMSWKLSTQHAISCGILSTLMATSFWLRTFSQSCNVCNQLISWKWKTVEKHHFNRKQSENMSNMKSMYQNIYWYSIPGLICFKSIFLGKINKSTRISQNQ